MSDEAPPIDPHATSADAVPLPPASMAAFDADEIAGTMIGPYKLLQLLGKGGMGAVWMAEQREPVQRRVAVKIIKASLHGDQVLARFEAERQALALMDHPNIAKVLDAGATSTGRPYVVMELVKGMPFSKYCDDENLTLKERVELFIPVCQAVQHAHQKGIIHRDLKPSNVLVALYDGKAVPKVIDFGVAKATTQRLTERTMYTEVGQIVGTLEYMAPEQAELNNLDIDTRADIYSLGVMLYELLTGEPPFTAKQLRGEAFVEMLRLIHDVEPPRPSSKLSKSGDLPAIAAKRKLEPKKLPRLVQGDLDWIVMKCLEKERGRRYETANQLGDELTRYLADEPVQAGPPSASYRARKFFRRHQGATIATTLVALFFVAFIGLVVYTRLSTHAAGLVEALLIADIDRVPQKIDELGPISRWWADPVLRNAKANAEHARDEGQALRASLALLPVDASQTDYLYHRMLVATPHELPVIRDALLPHQAELANRLWAVVEKSQRGHKQHRLRAAAALASYDPNSPRWDKASAQAAKDLVSVNPVFLGRWSEAFRPVKSRLIPPLTDIFAERDAERAAERTLATNLLADYAADQPSLLAKLLLDADASQFAVLHPKLHSHADRGLPVLIDELDRKLAANAADAERLQLAKRQTNAAVAMLRMNHPARVWKLLKHSADPTVRSYLVHRLGPLGADPGDIGRRLEDEPDVSIRRALILSLGEFGADSWTPGAKNQLVQQVQTIYRTASDPGIHAAAEWLLRRWHDERWLQQTQDSWRADKGERKKRLDSIEIALTTEKAKAAPQWYLTGEGHTMVVIPGPVVFEMGSPDAQPRRAIGETLHRKRIGRSFAVASKAVTIKQYLRARKPQSDWELAFIKDRAASEDCPARATWFMAAEYCNWLSDQEGQPKCYETDAKGKVTRLARNYLELTGYRLPTESEWEYACRAGLVTSRYYFGDAEDLLGQYAWFGPNADEQPWPVGGKKPNDLGLFDMHGNVWNWCQTELDKYPTEKVSAPFEDKDDTVELDPAKTRIIRGGSFSHSAAVLRCAHRNWELPTERYITYGFRPVRTWR